MDHIRNIVNDKERFNKSSNDNVEQDPFLEDKISYWLQDKLKSTSDISDRFYRKLARNVPRTTIERHLIYALETGHSPAKLFAYLAKKELKKRGIPVGEDHREH